MKIGFRAAIGIKLALTFFLLAVVLHQVSLSEIRSQLSAADPWYALASCLTLPVVVALSAWRWQILAGGLLSFSRALRYTWIWVFYSHVLPGVVTADAAKGLSLAARDKDTRVSMLPASIVVDRSIGLVTLLLFVDAACVGLYFWDEDAFLALRAVAFAGFGLSAAAIAGVLLLPSILRRFEKPEWALAEGRFRRGVARMSAIFASYGKGEGLRKLMLAFGITVIAHSLNTVGLFLGYRAIGGERSALVALIAYPLFALLFFVPVSISGIGLRELALIPVFQLLGVSAAMAVALSWINLAAAVPSIAIGVALQLREIYRR